MAVVVVGAVSLSASAVAVFVRLNESEQTPSSSPLWLITTGGLVGLFAVGLGVVMLQRLLNAAEAGRAGAEERERERARLDREEAIQRLSEEIVQKASAYDAAQELGGHFDEQAEKYRRGSIHWLKLTAAALVFLVGVAVWMLLSDYSPNTDKTSDLVAFVVRNVVLLLVPIYALRVGVNQYRRSDELATMAETKAVLVRSARALADNAPPDVQADLYRMLGQSVFSVTALPASPNEPLTLAEQLAAAIPRQP